MKATRYFLAFLLLGSTLAVGAAALTGTGVSPAEEPQGISLRQESARPGGFFYAYRSHQGGGLRGGK